MGPFFVSRVVFNVWGYWGNTPSGVAAMTNRGSLDTIGCPMSDCLDVGPGPGPSVERCGFKLVGQLHHIHHNITSSKYIWRGIFFNIWQEKVPYWQVTVSFFNFMSKRTWEGKKGALNKLNNLNLMGFWPEAEKIKEGGELDYAKLVHNSSVFRHSSNRTT